MNCKLLIYFDYLKFSCDFLHLFAEEVNAHSFSRKLLMRVLLEIIFFEQIVFEQSSRSFNEDFKVKSDYALKDTLSRKST
jgi:hypothetical protein